VTPEQRRTALDGTHAMTDTKSVTDAIEIACLELERDAALAVGNMWRFFLKQAEIRWRLDRDATIDLWSALPESAKLTNGK
jgi:hypothetical protein